MIGVGTRAPERRRPSPLRWIPGGLGLATAALFVALLGYGVMAQRPSDGIDASLARGQPIAAPPFRLAVLQPGTLSPALGRRLAVLLREPTISLRDLRGTPLVLNFYASWCVTCRAEASTLERIWRQQARPRGVLVLGIDMEDARGDARAYTRQYGIDYPSVRDPGGDVAGLYGLTGIPETFFIDVKGDVVGHIIGISSGSQLAAGIASALAGSVGAAQSAGAQRPVR